MPNPPSAPAEPIAVVVPVHNAADRAGKVVAEWAAFLRTRTAEFDLILVDDGSTDGTAAALEQLRESVPQLKLLRHDARRGFGACLRTALPECTRPLVAYAGADYPYTPTDLGKLLARIGETNDIYGTKRPIEAASGVRTGRRVPAVWQAVGFLYRLFLRVALGVRPEPLPGWLSFREHARSWWLWLVMGVPLTDPNAAFKVFRRSLFDRFPVQSDGDFVHAEIFAKLTFLTVLVAEEALSPKPDPVPRAAWADFWAVFKNAQFHHPLPDLSKPTPAVEAPAADAARLDPTA